jgi:TM2 domain-containing membrane protein YozV
MTEGLTPPANHPADDLGTAGPVSAGPPQTGPVPAPGTEPGWGQQQPPNWGSPSGGPDPAGSPPPGPGAPTKFCHACGRPIDARAEICPNCGVRQPFIPGMARSGIAVTDATTRTGKSKIVAALLAIFLGSFGIHKFYLGENRLGVLYLAFFWTAVPGIIGFVEGIIWIFQDDQVWLARYGDR